MEKKILVFAATYNESENIEEFLKTILKLNIKLDILIIDDNSPDKTWEIVNRYKKSNKNIELIKREEKEGLETLANKESQMEEKEKSDQMMQAEAILNAIKGQEKINQKYKILKSKDYKYEKDW